MTFFDTISFFFVAIILTIILLAYFFAIFYFKGKRKLPKWIVFVGVLVVWFAWHTNYDTYKKQKEWVEMDEGLKKYFTEKTNDLLLVPADSIVEGNDKVLEGKMIAVIQDDEKKEARLEHRLNDKLKEFGKFTSNPDSLDYVIFLLPYWHTDYYSGGNTSLTEMANVFVLDYKADSVVKTVTFDENKNPFFVTRNKRSGGSSETHNLRDDELYDGIIYNNKRDYY